MLNIIKNMGNLSPYISDPGQEKVQPQGSWCPKLAEQILYQKPPCNFPWLLPFRADHFPAQFAWFRLAALTASPPPMPTLCINSKRASSLGGEELSGALTYPVFRVTHVSVWWQVPIFV